LANKSLMFIASQLANATSSEKSKPPATTRRPPDTVALPAEQTPAAQRLANGKLLKDRQASFPSLGLRTDNTAPSQ